MIMKLHCTKAFLVQLFLKVVLKETHWTLNLSTILNKYITIHTLYITYSCLQCWKQACKDPHTQYYILEIVFVFYINYINNITSTVNWTIHFNMDVYR